VERRTSPLTYWATWEALVLLYDRAKVERPAKPWHSLRHTFGTELARSGTPIHVIKKLMGHRSIETTLRYMHHDENDQRTALGNTFG
jgi:site-specific recombinase XerD